MDNNIDYPAIAARKWPSRTVSGTGPWAILTPGRVHLVPTIIEALDGARSADARVVMIRSERKDQWPRYDD